LNERPIKMPHTIFCFIKNKSIISEGGKGAEAAALPAVSDRLIKFPS
jgi:hypothetical protein